MADRRRRLHSEWRRHDSSVRCRTQPQPRGSAGIVPLPRIGRDDRALRLDAPRASPSRRSLAGPHLGPTQPPQFNRGSYDMMGGVANRPHSMFIQGALPRLSRRGMVAPRRAWNARVAATWMVAVPNGRADNHRHVPSSYDSTQQRQDARGLANWCVRCVMVDGENILRRAKEWHDGSLASRFDAIIMTRATERLCPTPYICTTRRRSLISQWRSPTRPLVTREGFPEVLHQRVASRHARREGGHFTRPRGQVGPLSRHAGSHNAAISVLPGTQQDPAPCSRVGIHDADPRDPSSHSDDIGQSASPFRQAAE